ncbi:MAG: hypothetical protein WCH99_16795 [Verrucomicrobiota bacterium]
MITFTETKWCNDANIKASSHINRRWRRKKTETHETQGHHQLSQSCKDEDVQASWTKQPTDLTLIFYSTEKYILTRKTIYEDTMANPFLLADLHHGYSSGKN